MIPGWVNKYIGIPFEGCNCWQLVCRVYKEQFKIEIPTYEAEYFHALDRENIKKIYLREMEIWQKVQSPKIGDVIVCRIEGQPWHAGIVVGPNDMLHTELGTESIVERYDGFIWKNRIIGFYRYKN